MYVHRQRQPERCQFITVTLVKQQRTKNPEISDPKTQTPRNKKRKKDLDLQLSQFLSPNMFYGHTMFTGNSQK